MKSLADLQAIREKMQRQMDLRDADGDQIRVVVGMATCGIAAGARPVLTAFLEEIEKRDLKNITVAQTGCPRTRCPPSSASTLSTAAW